MAIPPGHVSPSFFIALWNADLTSSRLIPMSIVAPSVMARVTVTEGYRDASFAVWGDTSADQLVGLVVRRRVEFWAAYKDEASAVWQERLYSGEIKRIFPRKEADGKSSIAVTLYGVWEKAQNCPTMKRYANPAQVDKSAWFADLVARFVQPRYPLLIPDVLPVGAVSDTLDAYETTFGSAAQTLAQNTAKVVMGGGRLGSDPFAPDTLIFRPFETADATPHIIDFSSSQVSVNRGNEQDDTKRATELRINGGPLKDSLKNILKEAVDGNTSFEFPEIPGASGVGNLAQNPGFENGDKTNPTSWALQNGASIKEQTDKGIAPFSGNRYLELDAVNEGAFQLDLPEEALVVGSGYVLDCRARRENAAFAATGQLRYQWRNSGGAYFGPVGTFDITPTTSIWDVFGGVVIPPAGAVELSIEPRCTATDGANKGLLIDEVRFFSGTQVRQKGWEAVSDEEDGAFFNTIRWDDDVSPWHGGRCVFADVVAADSDGQNARIQPTNLARFPVAGGAHLRCGAFVKLAFDSPDMIVRPELYEYGGGNQYVGKTETGQITLTSENWTLIYTDRQYASNAEEGSFAIQFRSTGGLYIDGCFVQDFTAPLPDAMKPAQFIECDTFKTTLTVPDLFAPGTEPYTAYLEIGLVPETEDQQGITTQADAEDYARDWFEYYATTVDRPNFETFGVLSTGRGTTASAWPGELIRGIGKDGSNVLPIAKPLFEKEIRWTKESGLSITFSCNQKKRDPAEKLVEINRKSVRPYLMQIINASTRGGSVGRGTTSSSGEITGVDDGTSG